MFDRRSQNQLMERSDRWCLRGCIASSSVLLLVLMFQWNLVDVVTPFLMPLVMLGAGILFLGSGLWALVSAIAGRRRGYQAAIPLALVAVVALVAWFTPFTRLWLDANYRWHRADRRRVVSLVQAGLLKVDSNGVVALGTGGPTLSMGGNEILVEEHEGKRYVFFFTFRGILDNYSGFLFVPPGGRPTLFNDLHEADSTQLVSLEDGWYFAGHR